MARDRRPPRRRLGTFYLLVARRAASFLRSLSDPAPGRPELSRLLLDCSPSDVVIQAVFAIHSFEARTHPPILIGASSHVLIVSGACTGSSEEDHSALRARPAQAGAAGDRNSRSSRGGTRFLGGTGRVGAELRVLSAQSVTRTSSRQLDVHDEAIERRISGAGGTETPLAHAGSSLASRREIAPHLRCATTWFVSSPRCSCARSSRLLVVSPRAASPVIARAGR